MKIVKELFSSKKFIAMLAGILFMIVNKFGLNIDEDTVTKILGLIATYIVGQSIADVGKEKEKIKVGKK